MTTHRPTGWNTWDFRGLNRFVYLARGRTKITIEFAIWDEHVPPPTPDSKQLGHLYDTFRWNDVTRLGPHAPLSLPASLELRAGQSEYRIEALDRGGTLELTLTPLTPTQHRVVFRFLAPAGETVTVRSPTAGRFAGCIVDLDGATWPTDYFLNIAEPYAVGKPGRPATLRVQAARASTAPPTLEAYQQACIAGLHELTDAPQAMLPAVTWNTLFDTRRRLVCSPVSRDWCYDWRGVLCFCWDTYLVAAMVSYESPELARLNFEAVSAAIDELGFVPNYYMAHGAASRDRSMPPLGAYLIWKTQCAAPDRPWLRRMYPRLRRWHEFWMKHRSKGGTGLLAWGSNAEPAYEFPQLLPYNPTLRHSQRAAMWESGLDNSPMYDEVPFNPQTNTLELDDVGLSSYYAMDCEALACIADCLGRRRDAAACRAEHQTMASRINNLLWDEARGIYCNRHWDGRLSPRWSPTSFFPLTAAVAPRERAERLISEHLLNEREFWGRYVIPSISRSDPAYPDNDYWRGRIWGPFNFLVAEGLRRYRFDDVAAELARKSLNLFMQNWRADGGVYENYNAETGQGGDVWNAARLYHWGGLLALIAMEEVAALEFPGYLRVGSRKFPHAGLRNVKLAGCNYTVDMQESMRVWRDGRLFLETSPRAIVRIPTGPPDRPIEISAENPGRVIFHGSARPPRAARVNGQMLIEPAGDPPQYAYAW